MLSALFCRLTICSFLLVCITMAKKIAEKDKDGVNMCCSRFIEVCVLAEDKSCEGRGVGCPLAACNQASLKQNGDELQAAILPWTGQNGTCGDNREKYEYRCATNCRCTQCEKGQYESRPATYTSDRQCVDGLDSVAEEGKDDVSYLNQPTVTAPSRISRDAHMGGGVDNDDDDDDDDDDYDDDDDGNSTYATVVVRSGRCQDYPGGQVIPDLKTCEEEAAKVQGWESCTDTFSVASWFMHFEGEYPQGCFHSPNTHCGAKLHFNSNSGEPENWAECTSKLKCLCQIPEDDGCKSGMFLCATGERCIRENWVCDKAADCEDGSDEVDCPTETTTSATAGADDDDGRIDPNKAQENAIRCGQGPCMLSFIPFVSDAALVAELSTNPCSALTSEKLAGAMSCARGDAVNCGGILAMLDICIASTTSGLGSGSGSGSGSVSTTTTITTTLHEIRLSDGSATRGRLELLHNGQWSTVCDDDFGSPDGAVACRQLGLGSYVGTYDASGGSGSILYDDLACSGSESSLYDCSKRSGSSDCGHDEDIGLECRDAEESSPGSGFPDGFPGFPFSGFPDEFFGKGDDDVTENGDDYGDGMSDLLDTIFSGSGSSNLPVPGSGVSGNFPSGLPPLLLGAGTHCNNKDIREICSKSGGAMCHNQEIIGFPSAVCTCKSEKACEGRNCLPGSRQWIPFQCPNCKCMPVEQPEFYFSNFKATKQWQRKKDKYKSLVEGLFEPDTAEAAGTGLMAYENEQYAIDSIFTVTELTVNDMFEGAFDNEMHAVLFKLAFTKIGECSSGEGRRERRLPKDSGPTLPPVQRPEPPMLKRTMRGGNPPYNASADDQLCVQDDLQLCEHPLVGDVFRKNCPYLCGQSTTTITSTDTTSTTTSETSTTTSITSTTTTTTTSITSSTTTTTTATTTTETTVTETTVTDTTTTTTTTSTTTTTTVAASQQPGNFLIDPKTGYILAQAENCGTYHAKMIAMDKNDAEITMFDWNFTVKLRPEMVVTWAASPPQGTLGEIFEMEPPAVVGKDEHRRLNQSDFVYRVDKSSTLPEGMALDLGNGMLYGVPRSAGIYDMNITATDLNSPGVKPVRVNKTQVHSVTLKVVECADMLSCNNHGSCNTRSDPYDGDFTCTCNKGWKGAGCELAASPSVGPAVGGSVGGLLVLLCAASLLVAWRAHQRSIAPVDFQAKFRDMVAAGELTGFETEDADNDGTGLPREIRRSTVTLVERLGKGSFGDVWKGILDESNTGGAPGYLVAAKTVLNEGASNEAATEELLQEAIVMSKVGAHENLVSVIGTITSGTPIILLLSFCEHGSFLSLLKRSAKAEYDSLATRDRLKFAAGIARGMAYLISKRFVHRDLAARNCLVATGMVAKVADFGLSRSGVSSSGYYYYKSQSGMFPVRWTAPEAMATMKFTAASDAWSFGIVLMEAFTDGATPYGKWKTEVVSVHIMGGYRLPKPETCPEDIYAVMSDCWHEDPACRPTFDSLAATLEELAAREGPSAGSLDSNHYEASDGDTTVSNVVYKKSLFGVNESSSSGTTDATGYQQCMYNRVVATEVDQSDAHGLLLLQNSLPYAPAMSLLEACKLAAVHCHTNLEHAADDALLFATSVQRSVVAGKKYASLGLSELDISAVHLYTQETPLYSAINGALGGWGMPDGIQGIPHYVGFIKLLLAALAKLPPMVDEEVFRGVRGTPLSVLLNGKGVGDTLVWGAFTSTSKSIGTLHDPHFFGFGPGLGVRVIFQIKIQSGVEIRELSDRGSLFGSAHEDEQEVLLIPGTTFVIDAITPLPNDVTQVQMHEVVSMQHPKLAAALTMLPPAPVHVHTPADDDGDDDGYGHAQIGGAGEGPVGKTEEQRLEVRRRSMDIATEVEGKFVVTLPQKTSGSKMIVVCSASASDSSVGKIEIYNKKGKSSTSMPLKTIRLKNVVAVGKVPAKKQPDSVVVEDSANPNNPFTFAPASNNAKSTALIDELFEFIQHRKGTVVPFYTVSENSNSMELVPMANDDGTNGQVTSESVL